MRCRISSCSIKTMVALSVMVSCAAANGTDPNQSVSDAQSYLLKTSFERESKTKSVSKVQTDKGQTIPLPDTEEVSIVRFAPSIDKDAVWTKRSGTGKSDEWILRNASLMVRQTKDSKWQVATQEQFQGLERLTDLRGNPFLLPVLVTEATSKLWTYSRDEVLDGNPAMVLELNGQELLGQVKDYHSQLFGSMFKGKKDAPVKVKLESASVSLWISKKDSSPLKLMIAQAMQVIPDSPPDGEKITIHGSTTTTVVFRYGVKELSIPQEAIKLLSEESQK